MEDTEGPGAVSSLRRFGSVVAGDAVQKTASSQDSIKSHEVKQAREAYT